MQVIFIIPAYNEEENLPVLLEGLRERMQSLGRPYHVIVVDDGSQDRTAEVASSYAPEISIEVIRQPVNRGVGEAFRTGFHRALALAGPEDAIVTKEADNTSDLSILPQILKKLEAGDDVVLASCFALHGEVVGSSFDRHCLSFGANLLVRTCFSIPGVHTYSSFYRAYRAEALKRAFAAYDGNLLSRPGFACMVEMVIKLSRLPIRISEVPMTLRCNLRRGRSKMSRLKTIGEYLSLIGREAVRSRQRDRQVSEIFTSLGRREAVKA